MQDTIVGKKKKNTISALYHPTTVHSFKALRLTRFDKELDSCGGADRIRQESLQGHLLLPMFRRSEGCFISGY